MSVSVLLRIASQIPLAEGGKLGQLSSTLTNRGRVFLAGSEATCILTDPNERFRSISRPGAQSRLWVRRVQNMLHAKRKNWLPAHVKMRLWTRK